MQPYYDEPGIQIFHGDCRDVLPGLASVDVVVTDPPYGETSLDWDLEVNQWVSLLPSHNLWCFASMRFLLTQAQEFAGWKFAQDLIWQKQNGSNFHADRFWRIHEHVVQFYRGYWRDIYHHPVYTLDATAKTVRRRDTARPHGIDRTGSLSQ